MPGTFELQHCFLLDREKLHCFEVEQPLDHDCEDFISGKIFAVRCFALSCSNQLRFTISQLKLDLEVTYDEPHR